MKQGKNKMEGKIKGEKLLYIFLGIIILIGGIVPFAAQFLCPFFYPDRGVVGAEVWNQYVSIILGVIATITSIVSLVLGFRNEKENYETEIRTRDLLHKIQKKIVKISIRQEIQGFMKTNPVSKTPSDAKSNPTDENIE